MTRITWGAPGERTYEAGVDRGVLYALSGPGVPWNGLISVSENSSGGEITPLYLDGVKFRNVTTAEDFEATLTAFSSPPEFDLCDGVASIAKGLFVTQQPRRPFGLTYRTLVGNDLKGNDFGYKIHIIYNALAAPSERSRDTVGDSLSPMNVSWDLSVLPPVLSGHRPTAHFVVDSRKTNLLTLSFLEMILYGSTNTAPRLPTPTELVALFATQYPPISGQIVMLGPASNNSVSIYNYARHPIGVNATIGNTLSYWRELNSGPKSFITDNGAPAMEFRGQQDGGEVQVWSSDGYTAADGASVGQFVAIGVDVRPMDYETQQSFKHRTRALENMEVSPGSYKVSTLASSGYTRVTSVDEIVAVGDGASTDRILAEFFSESVGNPNKANDPSFLTPSVWSPTAGSSFGAAGTGMDGVTEGSLVFDGSQVAAEKYSVPNPNLPSSVLQYGLPVLPGERLSLSVWAKSSTPIQTDGVSANLVVRFQDMGSPANPPSGSYISPITAIPPNTWGEIAGTVVAPTNVVGPLRMYIILRKESSLLSPLTFSTLSIRRGRGYRLKNLVIASGPSAAEATARVSTYFDGDTSRVFQNQQARGLWLGSSNDAISELSYYTVLQTVKPSGSVYEIDGAFWVFTDLGYWVNIGGTPV